MISSKHNELSILIHGVLQINMSHLLIYSVRFFLFMFFIFIISPIFNIKNTYYELIYLVVSIPFIIFIVIPSFYAEDHPVLEYIMRYYIGNSNSVLLRLVFIYGYAIATFMSILYNFFILREYVFLYGDQW